MAQKTAKYTRKSAILSATRQNIFGTITQIRLTFNGIQKYYQINFNNDLINHKRIYLHTIQPNLLIK